MTATKIEFVLQRSNDQDDKIFSIKAAAWKRKCKCKIIRFRSSDPGTVKVEVSGRPNAIGEIMSQEYLNLLF